MKNRKPLLLVKLGHPDLLVGNGWIPSKEDLAKVHDHLNNLVGDQYNIFVFHAGIEVEVVGDAEAVKQAEIISLDELRRETLYPVKEDDDA